MIPTYLGFGGVNNQGIIGWKKEMYVSDNIRMYRKDDELMG